MQIKKEGAKMNREEIEKNSFDYFQSGFNCAESVSMVITEAFAAYPARDIPKVATAFGGGMGRSKAETCGTLTGGIIALGYLYGRMSPSEDPSEVHKLAAEFRKRFIEKNGSSTCHIILEKFGEQENLIKCKKMTSEVAGILHDLLTKKMVSN